MLALLALVAFATVVVVHVRQPLDGWGGSALAVLYGHATEYAPSYSEETFATLRPGMPMEDVQALLGKPLDEYILEDGKVGWRYSRSPRDMSYRVRVVLFMDGKVHETIHEFHMD